MDKINPSVQAETNMDTYKGIIDVSIEVFQRVSNRMQGDKQDEQKYTIRELLRGKIYNIKDPEF